MLHKLVQQVQLKWLEQVSGHFSYQLALSGGIDSVVLLHILSRVSHELNFKLSAIHIHHGLSPNAESWTEFCRELCLKLNVELTIVRHTVTRTGGESLENNARKIRYAAFTQSNADVMILAHHQNDQIESVLSQIMRGSDLHNIAGMRELSTKGQQTYWRPLLNVTRHAIEDYAGEFDLSYITDESNFDTSYLRNFIRHDILPRLLKFDTNMGSKILKLPQQLSG